jgi:hypothetical protein
MQGFILAQPTQWLPSGKRGLCKASGGTYAL